MKKMTSTYILAHVYGKSYIKSQIQSHITKQLLTSILVDLRLYQPSNVLFISASGLGEYHF